MILSLALLLPLAVAGFSTSQVKSFGSLTRNNNDVTDSPFTVLNAVRNQKGTISDRDAYIAKLKAINDEKQTAKNFFTGGALDKLENQAIKLASSPRLKSVKDLGWTQPPKRKGSTRPRHRAFGGEGEKPIQLKPNYDETNANCVEKWLTLDDFYKFVKDDSPAADTVFCALAGGAAYAERHVVESKLNAWRPNNKFDETAFLKDVKKGRIELFTGWAFFLSLNATFLSCIIFPTSPLTKALESLIQSVLDSAPPPVA